MAAASAPHSPPPKARAFGVVVPLGTSPDDLIHAVAGVVGLPEVYSAQHLGAQSFEIVINSRLAAAKLTEAGVITIASTQVPIVPAGPQVTNVTCMFLPTYVRNDLLVQALSAHGKVLEITHATYRSTPTVKTGTRYVRIEMKESDPVPNFLRIGGHRATFDYPGIKRVCRRCRLEGHIRANCTTEHCDRCAVFGHATEGCTSDCRRCGGSHATVDCVARRSYSSMVAGTASSDFPPLSPAHEVSPPRPAAQTGASTDLTKPQANVDPKNSQSALSGGRPPPAPLTDATGAMAPETQLVTPAPSLSAVDTHTPWSEVTEDPEVSSDDERLVIMEDESPVAEDPSLSSLGAPSTSVAPVTAGNKDSTNSSEPSDLAGNSDPTDARRGQALDAKRAISSSGSRSPRGRDKAGRRPKKPRPSSRDTSFSSAEDV